MSEVEQTEQQGDTESSANQPQNLYAESDGKSAKSEESGENVEEKQQQESEEKDKSEESKESDPEKSDEEKDGQKEEPIEYDLKLPEDTLLTDTHLKDIEDFARESGLSKEAAEKLVERDNQLINETLVKFQEDTAAEVKQKTVQWVEDLRRDKEFGGNQFVENAEIAKRFIDDFGSDDFKKVLDETGMGNHPELFKMIVRASRDMRDDSFVRKKSTNGQLTQAQILYPEESN